MASDNTFTVDAVTRLQKFLVLDPANRTLRTQLINEACNSQQWTVAREVCEAGLQQDGERSDLWAHLGYVELATGHIDRSLIAFQRATELGVQDPTVIFNFAQALFFAGDFSAARAKLNNVDLNDGPLKKPVVLCELRCLHHLEEYEEAKKVARQFLASSNDADVLGVLALILYDANQNIDAELAANDALSIDQLQLEARLAHGGVCFETGRYDEAKFDYEMALKRDAKSGRAWSGKAQIEFNDFQFDEALLSLDEAVRYMPNHIGTWHLMVWIHLLRKNEEAAAIAVNKALDLDRNFGESHGALAAVQALQGKTEEARASIKRAQRLNPLGFAAYYAQLLLLEVEGKGDEAKQLLNTFMNTPHLNLGTTPDALVKKRLLELSENMTKH